MRTAKYSISDLYSLKIKAFFEAFRLESVAFKLVCLSLFFEYVRPQSIYPILAVIPWSQILLLSALGILVTNPDKRTWDIPKSTNKLHRKLTFLVFIFGLQCLLSSALAYSTEDAFENMPVIISWVIFYWLIVSTTHSERRFLFLFALFLLCNLKMSQHGFRVWAWRGFSFSSWGVGGSPGWFSNSGEFGIQMCIFFPMVVATIYGIREYISKVMFRFLLIIPVTAAGSVIASSSRGAMLGLLTIIGLYALRSGNVMKKVLIAVSAFAIIFIVTPDEFKSRFETAGEDTTSVTRFTYWANGVDMANSHPIAGVGYMNWVPYYRDHYYDASLYNRIEVAHNTFVQCMAELGYVGLLIFLLMSYYCVKININTIQVARTAGNKLYEYLGLSFNLALCSLFVTTFFIAALYYPFYWMHFALSIALNNAAIEASLKAKNPVTN